MQATAHEQAQEIELLRSALEFYADAVNYRSNWIFAENVLADHGSIARAALQSPALPSPIENKGGGQS